MNDRLNYLLNEW